MNNNSVLKSVNDVSVAEIKMKVKNLDFFYSKYHALKSINMDIQEKRVTAFIGPSWYFRNRRLSQCQFLITLLSALDCMNH